MIITKYAYKAATQPKLKTVGMSIHTLEDTILSAKKLKNFRCPVLPQSSLIIYQTEEYVTAVMLQVPICYCCHVASTNMLLLSCCKYQYVTAVMLQVPTAPLPLTCLFVSVKNDKCNSLQDSLYYFCSNKHQTKSFYTSTI